MMEMPIRKSRMLRNAEVLMRGRKVLTKNTVQENVLHRQRMTCAESVRSVTQTQDWTEGVRMSPSGRFQVIEEAKPRRRIISRSSGAEP